MAWDCTPIGCSTGSPGWSPVRGVASLHFHGLRHTHATLLLRQGVPANVVSERLGHASPAFTMSVYQHVLPGMQAEMASVAARLVDS